MIAECLVRRAPAAWSPDAKPWLVPDDGPLPTFKIAGDLTLTLLSPTVKKLKDMRNEWQSVINKAGFKPEDLDAAWDKLGQQKKFHPQDGLLGNGPDLDQLLEKQFLRDKAKPNGSASPCWQNTRTKRSCFSPMRITEPWLSEEAQAEHKYEAIVRAGADLSLTLTLL